MSQKLPITNSWLRVPGDDGKIGSKRAVDTYCLAYVWVFVQDGSVVGAASDSYSASWDPNSSTFYKDGSNSVFRQYKDRIEQLWGVSAQTLLLDHYSQTTPAPQPIPIPDSWYYLSHEPLPTPYADLHYFVVQVKDGQITGANCTSKTTFVGYAELHERVVGSRISDGHSKSLKEAEEHWAKLGHPSARETLLKTLGLSKQVVEQPARQPAESAETTTETNSNPAGLGIGVAAAIGFAALVGLEFAKYKQNKAAKVIQPVKHEA